MTDQDILFRSGSIIVVCKWQEIRDRRIYFDIVVYLVDDRTKAKRLFDQGPYNCPAFWGDEKIAQDVIGWMVDVHEELYNLVDIDEERSTDNEIFFAGEFI